MTKVLEDESDFLKILMFHSCLKLSEFEMGPFFFIFLVFSSSMTSKLRSCILNKGKVTKGIKMDDFITWMSSI